LRGREKLALGGQGRRVLSANSEIVIAIVPCPLTRRAKSGATSRREARGEARDSQLCAPTFFRLAKSLMSGEHQTCRPNQGPSSR
jgi:hypothetical protein